MGEKLVNPIHWKTEITVRSELELKSIESLDYHALLRSLQRRLGPARYNQTYTEVELRISVLFSLLHGLTVPLDCSTSR